LILWVGVKYAGFPLTKPMAANTGLINCAACNVNELGNLTATSLYTISDKFLIFAVLY